MQIEKLHSPLQRHILRIATSSVGDLAATTNAFHRFAVLLLRFVAVQQNAVGGGRGRHRRRRAGAVIQIAGRRRRQR